MANSLAKAIPKHVAARNKKKTKVSLLPDDAKAYVQTLNEEDISAEKISKALAEKFNIHVSKGAINHHYRLEKDKLEIAKQRIEKINEWAKILTKAAQETPEVDASNILKNLIQGDVLEFMTTNDMGERIKELSFDKLADITIKIGNANLQKERLALQKRAASVFSSLEEKTKKAGEAKPPNGDVAPLLREQIENLNRQYGPEQIKAAMIEAGIIPLSKSSQGLDPETLKTIREEVYGIFK